MKARIFSIIICLVMSAFAISSNAQNVVTGISTNDLGACVAYLDANPGDTIREVKERKLELAASADTTVTRNQGLTTIVLQKGDKLFFAGIDVWQENGEVLRGNHYVVLRQNPLPAKVVADSSIVAKVDSLAAATQAGELVASNYDKRERDRYYYQASVYKKTDGKIVKRGMDKYGWSPIFEAGYRFSEDINTFVGAAGIQYTHPIGGNWALGGIAQARVTQTVYPDNAVKAGEAYWTGGGRLGAEVGYALNTYKTIHLWLDAGIGLDFQRTETAKNENGLLQSENSEPYPFFGAKVTFEKFGKRYGGFLRVGGELNPVTKQNAGTSRSFAFVVTGGINLALLRHWFTTK